jgi:hypothetical protein
MSGQSKAPEFDRNFQPPERHVRFPRVALRQRSADHPMIMFAMLVSAAFVTMALLMPASGAVPAKPNGSPARIADQLHETGKAARLPRMSEKDEACQGQAWGAESKDCLLVINKESGKADARKIRMIADAGPPKTTPNVF